MSETNSCCCGQGKCDISRTPVQTPTGEVAILNSPLPKDHLEQKIRDAAYIEIDGCGKVVKYEHTYADKAEESYKKIVDNHADCKNESQPVQQPTTVKLIKTEKTEQTKRSFWRWLKSLFTIS